MGHVLTMTQGHRVEGRQLSDLKKKQKTQSCYTAADSSLFRPIEYSLLF